jgi:hypothetical protein
VNANHGDQVVEAVPFEVFTRYSYFTLLFNVGLLYSATCPDITPSTDPDAMAAAPTGFAPSLFQI